MRTQFWSVLVCVFVCSGLVMSAVPAWAGEIDGSLVNLAAIRGNTVTISQSIANSPMIPLHPGGSAPWDVRFKPKTGETQAWWCLDFGAGNAYNVADFKIQTYGGPTSSLWSTFVYKIEYSLTGGSDPSEWSTASVKGTTADADGWITMTAATGTVPGYFTGSFTSAINARFIRFVVPSSITDNTPYGAGAVLTWMHLTGPNTFSVHPDSPTAGKISLAQSTWNVGVGAPTYTDKLNTTPRAIPMFTDDFSLYAVPGSARGNNLYGTFVTIGNTVAGDDSTFVRAQITVPLNDTYAVSAVGFSTMQDSRRATEMEFWYSPDETGDRWYRVTSHVWDNTKQEFVPITTFNTSAVQHYYEFNFIDHEGNSLSYDAHRIRFDVLKSADTANGQCYFTQFYVYGAGIVPEPATMTLLALGGLAMLRRGRR